MKVDNVSQDRTLNTIYGFILDMLSYNDEDYYLPLVAPERTSFPADVVSNFIPLNHTVPYLIATYGEPRDLIGRRVRIEYYGTQWKTGVATIVPGRNPESLGTAGEVPSRGFRYAVAGEGSLL